MNNRVFVIPANDLEAIAIATLLTRAGETHWITNQPWGATWAALEPDIQLRLQALPPGTQIYGVELGGPNPFGAVNIDHHWYETDDRWRPDSSLEQLAALLALPLTREEQLIAANDRGYIPAMLALGATEAEVQHIRRQDRAAQGLTPADEQRAESDTARAVIRDRRAWVNVTGSPTSAHGDRLFGKVREWLLAGDDRWSYSGPRHQQFGANVGEENHWRGGAADSGYAGVANPSAQTQTRLRDWFWAE